MLDLLPYWHTSACHEFLPVASRGAHSQEARRVARVSPRQRSQLAANTHDRRQRRAGPSTQRRLPRAHASRRSSGRVGVARGHWLPQWCCQTRGPRGCLVETCTAWRVQVFWTQVAESDPISMKQVHRRVPNFPAIAFGIIHVGRCDSGRSGARADPTSPADMVLLPGKSRHHTKPRTVRMPRDCKSLPPRPPSPPPRAAVPALGTLLPTGRRHVHDVCNGPPASGNSNASSTRRDL